MAKSDKYYLVLQKYNNFDIGSIVRYDGKTFLNIEDDDMKLEGMVTENLVELEINEAHFLKNEEISIRNLKHEQKIFSKIDKLKINDFCLYDRSQCTVVNKSYINDYLYFDIKNNEGIPHSSVISNDIEFIEDNCLPSMKDETYHILINGLVLVGSDGSFKPYKGTTTLNMSAISLNDLFLLQISHDEAKVFYDIQKRLLEKIDKNISNSSNMDPFRMFQTNSNNKYTNVDKISDNTLSKSNKSNFSTTTKSIPQSSPHLEHSSGNVAEAESAAHLSLLDEEHEKAFLYLTEASKLTDNAKFIACLDLSVRMKDPKITENLINNSEVRINLETDITLFNKITQRGDITSIKAILAKSVSSAEDSKCLIKLMQRYHDQDIIHSVSNKVKGTTVTDETNREMLRTFWQCLINDVPIESLKEIIDCCTNLDDFIDGADTILTKMIKETDVARMTEVLTIRTFDVNKPNQCGKSPLILACEKQPDSEKLQLLMDYCKENKTDFKIEDRAKAAKVEYKDYDTYLKFYKIMHEQN